MVPPTILRLVLLVVSIGLIHLEAQPLALAFKPVDVHYSKSLDRLVMISGSPNQVHLVNPVTGAESIINLSLAPLSLSVSPDGKRAAVGHDGWISYVNLEAGYVEKNLAVSLLASTVVLSGNGSIWVPPSTTVNVGTGAQTSTYNFWSAHKPALHPNGNWIYYTRGGSPDDVIKGDISSGTFQYLYDSRYHGDFAICGGVFYSADGNRLLTGCGTLFRTTASSSDDLTYNGALSPAQQVTSAVDSVIARKFAVIPGNGWNTTSADTEVHFYDNEYLTLLGRVPLPIYTTGGVVAPWHGRHVFYSPDGTKLYVVLQADSKANLVNDYAIYSLTLSTGSVCNPSLTFNSATVAASGGNVDVPVNATAGCLWQASSNATWISLGEGGISSGSGTLKLHANPNLQTVSRSATVTIAGLTFTLTQDAAAAPGSNPVTASPVRPITVDYSHALDRMILVSANPNLLTILNPVTGNSQVVTLSMPPTALSISTDGLHAAVGHDGRISYINLASATLEKNLSVTTTVFALALGATHIYAFPLLDQWEEVRVVNIASGAETLWNWIYAGSTAGKISPNGKYLYINATKRYDITQPLAPAFDATYGNSPQQWFSQDGSRLFSGSGQAYRLSDIASQDLQYNGTLETGGLTAVADSSVQQVTATVAIGPPADTSIKFFGQQYLNTIGSIAIPKFTSGSNSFDAHGRYLFWNAAGNRLFAVVQADQTSGFLNDYAIYTVSLNGGCNTSLANSTASPTAAGGSFSVMVTANAGCAWKATSSAPWLTISANALSAGSASIGYIVDPNPTTTPRTASITVDGKTLTVNQAGGTQAQPSAILGLPFRVADAEYSNSLDRIVAISGSPNRLYIYNPTTAESLPVALPLAGNAVSVQPSGLRAAVCHDGLVSIVNLQTATLEKTINISVNCHDIVFADNGYVYMSVRGGWGSSSSVNVSTGAETKLDLYYDGTTFQLNAAGDAVYTSNSGTSGQAVSRYSITGGPMKKDYSSEVYPAHPAGNRLWFTRDGRFAGDSGSVFRTGSTQATDFIYTGTLSGFAGYPGVIGSAAHSTTRRMFASVGSNGGYWESSNDTTLFLHGDKYLVNSSKVTLPKITIGGASANSHGKFVFWDSGGTKLYVILQADSSAGFLNDFAVYTLSREFTPGCGVTLGVTSATAISYADVGNVAVNSESNCVWEVQSNVSWIQIDSGTLGVGIGNVGYSVLANPATVARTGTIAIGNQTFSVTQAAGGSSPAPPQANSVTPSASSGSSQLFAFTFSDPNGETDLHSMRVIINSQPQGNDSCYVYYTKSDNRLYLHNDAGNALLAGMTVGSPGTTQNSRCAIDGAGSSAVPAGNNLTLNLAVSFPGSFGGAKNIYAQAQDLGGLNSGWQTLGTFNITGGGSPSGPQAPQTVSVNPSSGSGSGQTFTFTYSDANGHADIHSARILIQTQVQGSNACYLYYTKGDNRLYLHNDAGNGLLAGISPGVAGSTQNNQCTVNGALSSASATGNQLTLNVAITFNAGFAGARSLYASVQDIGGLNSNWQTLGSFAVAGGGGPSPSPSAPQAVSVTPASGSGSSQTFTFTYSDANGHADIHSARILIHSQVKGAASCYLYYTKADNKLYLHNDAGNGLLAGITPGVSGTTQNSQCSVNGASSSAAASGNSLTLTVAVTFTGSFAGTKGLFASVQDIGGLNSNWQTLGGFTVTGGGTPSPGPSAPEALPASPSGASGSSQTFQFSYSDSNGHADIHSVRILIHPQIQGATSCYVYYTKADNRLYLHSDAGNALLAGITPGSPGTTQNSQCSVVGATSSVSASQSSLSLTLSFTFTPGYAGAKAIYSSVQDVGGLSSGWQNVGTFTVTGGGSPAPGPQPPQAVSVSPASGAGSTQAFTFTYSDPNGHADIHSARILIDSAIDGIGACYLYYTKSDNRLYLHSDAGNALLAGITPGVAGTTQNSQCSVNGANSSATGSGNDLTLTVAITFAGGFGGTRTLYGSVQDFGGLTSNWQTLGAFTVTNGTAGPTPAAPQAVSVAPSSGSGPTQTFTAVYSDSNGHSDIHSVRILIHPQVQGANACYLYYTKADNRLYLHSDAGNALLPGLTLGSGTMQNSQCSINGSASSSLASGNTLTLNVAITFAPAFSGSKNMHLFAHDAGGLTSGWQTLGTWSIP
jgi:hypothetical protein